MALLIYEHAVKTEGKVRTRTRNAYGNKKRKSEMSYYDVDNFLGNQSTGPYLSHRTIFSPMGLLAG